VDVFRVAVSVIGLNAVVLAPLDVAVGMILPVLGIR
jgi:hypothetical protein